MHRFGAFHTSEITLVFHNPYPVVFPNSTHTFFTSDENALSLEMVAYWSNFGISGNPNTPTAPSVTWPAYSSTDEGYLGLDLNIVAGSNYRGLWCDFWDTLQSGEAIMKAENVIGRFMY